PGFSPVRLFRADRAGAAPARRELQAREHLRRAGDTRGAEEVFELADLSTALRERRARWGLRHHAGDVSQRRAEGAAAGGRRDQLSAEEALNRRAAERACAADRQCSPLARCWSELPSASRIA